MGQDVDASCLGDEWKGYTLRITGGNDKQGFPMKQGVLTNGRVRLLLKKGHTCFRERRAGQKKRKSVRGCIVDANLSVMSMIIVKKGETVSITKQELYEDGPLLGWEFHSYTAASLLPRQGK